MIGLYNVNLIFNLFIKDFYDKETDKIIINEIGEKFV